MMRFCVREDVMQKNMKYRAIIISKISHDVLLRQGRHHAKKYEIQSHYYR